MAICNSQHANSVNSTNTQKSKVAQLYKAAENADKTSAAFKAITGIILTTALCSSAAASDIGFSVKAGTLGLGLELDYKINEILNVRFQSNGYTYSDELEEDDINYEGELSLASTGVLLDWRPFKGAFRLTGGVYANNNELTGYTKSVGNETYDIGDAVYRSSSTDPLTINMEATLGDSTVGFLGMGWGNTTSDSHWMFSVELGVLLTGEPTIDLSASGTAVISKNGLTQSFSITNVNNPLVQEFLKELTNEESNLEDDLSDFKAYPVIAVGIGYRF